MKNTHYITSAAIIAAMYVVLTYISNIFGLASGIIQLRLSEALTILPLLTPTAIPGLAIGCFISNIITGCTYIDVVFGTIATLLAAIGTYYIGKLPIRHKEYLAPISPIIFNALIIPFVLLISMPTETYGFILLSIFIGEAISCTAPAIFLYKAIKKLLYRDIT